MANCLVLGANGFIGSHLVDTLAESGHFVRCFDRYKSKYTSFENRQHHDIEIYRGDFLSRHSLESALDNIDFVFHFISTTNPFTAENDPLIDIETNVKMSVELFQLCVEKSVKKLIFASTGGSIYGDVEPEKPISEGLNPRPVSPYAIGKLSIEHYLRYFKRKHNLDYQVLRISNPYGPRQNTLSGQGVISIFLEKIKNNQPITVYGDGSMIRDYIYVEDAVEMIAKSFEQNATNNTYNLSSGKGHSVTELIQVIEKVTGLKPTIENAPVPSTFIHKVVLDPQLFINDFNVEATTPIEEGIQKTWQNLKTKS